MQLHVDFDDDLIKRYVARGSSPVFAIYWTQDGAAYPDDQWLDFGSVILSWWLVAAKSLLGGAAEADLSFMDGPFHLRARLVGNVLYVSADDQPWQGRTPIARFVSELVTATNQVQRKFEELGVTDKEGLQSGVQHLKAALSQANSKSLSNHAAVAEHVA